ncbi:hypothetical protein [Peptoniphilus harei]|uniref:hypothetical protein n=1 Tax=Peptoniphilus harei TaxID=54005 RepID=UPI0011DD9514|nr:hypothetical protein [Peptoniphilus harei]
MKKTLGQNGLNFIANKYKELKTALSYKVDNSQITDVYDAGDEELIPSLKALSELGKSLRRDLDRKVYKVSGKGLSANDYTDSDKAKVDAIPANPKYTDTTYDLSKYAEKSNISRCKTKGYNTSNTWESLSTERDLEDWIGDFDKRTRELRGGGGVEEISLPSSAPSQIKAYKCGNLVTIVIDSCSVGTLARTRITLPYSIRPMGDGLATSVPEGGSRGCFFRISSSGDFYLVNADNDNAYVHETITYISKN